MKALKTCLLLLLTLSLLTSCNTADTSTTITPTLAADLDIKELNAKGLTVVMFKSPIYEDDEAMAVYASELLAEAGWDVEFIIFEYSTNGVDSQRKEYRDLIMSLLESGKDLVFEDRGGHITLDDLKSGGYVKRGEDRLYDYRQTLGRRKEISYQGIYIDRELEELFGEEIDSIEAYDRFLVWAKENNPKETPCLMVMQSTLNESLNPVALFAQMAGYTRADNAIIGLRDTQSTVYMKDIDMLNYQNEKPEVYEAVELPFFIEMDGYLNRWAENGLVKIISYDEFDSTSGHSSIICHTKDTTNYYSRDYTDKRLRPLDVSDYNLHILTGDSIPSLSAHIKGISRSSAFIYASEKPSTALGKSFLEWIFNSTDNYYLFMFGKEGIDYEIVDGHLEFLTNPNGLSYGQWPAHSKFIDDRMLPVMPHFPYNWKDVMHEFSKTNEFRISALSKETTAEGYEVVSNRELNDMYAIPALESGVFSLYERYFNELGKRTGRYTPWDLRVDLENSASAQKRKEMWSEIMIFVDQ